MIKQFEHHGRLVWADEDAFGHHRRFCLCFRGCEKFKPNTPENCPIAQQLFELDMKHGLTTTVYECPEWEGEQVEPQHAYEYLPAVMNLVEDRMREKEKEWGNTWLQRSRSGQELRTFNSWADKWDKFFHGGVLFDWCDWIGDGAICLVRLVIAPHRWKA